MLVVSKIPDRKNEKIKTFCSLQNALEYLEHHPEEERKILVQPGRYQEQVTVSVSGVEIMGTSSNAAKETIITYGLAAREILSDGKKRGTFRTYTFFVNADKVTIKNITIENSAGPGEEAGQCIALYADGDRLTVDSCRLLGWMDTLFTAPLPPKEIEKNGFAGPKQFAPRRDTCQYYKNCYIEGEVDFIFGGATAYFENCTIYSKDIRQEVKGYVTAPSTPEGKKYGYVMEGCRFISNCPDQTVYLGRPWREWGQVVLLRCEIGSHIKAEGWDDWGKEQAHSSSFFAEYCCTGPGAGLSARPDWCHVLDKKEAEDYRKEKVVYWIGAECSGQSQESV